MSFSIRVPATTANLGPGFDCLGLALNIWNEVEVSAEGTRLSIEIEGSGANTLPTNAENAIYRAMLAYSKLHHKMLPPGLHLRCTNRIPLGSGLGSSSAAAIAGILAATAILQLRPDIENQLYCATQLEGHPDNVAPCLMGGLIASLLQENCVLTASLPVSAFNLILIHPNFHFPTHLARAALPKQILHSDAVFNASHLVFVIEALRTGDLTLLNQAMQDRLHQPYRLPLIPGAETAILAAQNAGAVTALSGAGPSLLVFSPSRALNPMIASEMQSAFLHAGLSSEVFFPEVSLAGAALSLN